MSGRIESITLAEGRIHGARSIAVRLARRIARRGNALALGWGSGFVPLGSTVIGAKRISVGPGFDAARPVWIEAVTEYAGERFDPEIRIGARFSTSGHLHVSAIDAVRIGDDCLFGSNVYIGDHAHGDYRGSAPSTPASPPRDRALRSAGPVSIGDRVWFGDNVVVLGGVSIGAGCVVGANSVVTRSLAPGTIAAGSPARPIKQWDDGTRSWVRSAAAAQERNDEDPARVVGLRRRLPRRHHELRPDARCEPDRGR